MKARTIGCELYLLLAFAAGADVGGGSGKAVTPYGADTPTEARVLELQKQASRAMSVHAVPLSTTNAPKSGFNVGFAYVRDESKLPAPRFAFVGTDDDGRQREIPIANVKSFRLMEVDHELIGADRAILEITEFPNITPKELLKQKPAYTTLVEKYTKKTRLTVPLESDDGELSMIGTEFFTETEYGHLFRIRDLKPDVEITFDPNLRARMIWWATPSVIADKAYPHRVVMKR